MRVLNSPQSSKSLDKAIKAACEVPSILEHRKDALFRAHERDILASSHIVAFGDMLQLHRLADCTSGAHHQPDEPVRRQFVNRTASRRHPLFLPTTPLLEALIVEGSVGVGTRYP